MTATGGGPFTVLVVCTGNICRSPQAAQLLRAKVDEAGVPWRDAVAISSAGTRAMEGFPMDPLAAELSRGLGADPAQHRARQLTTELVQAADLVLCMAREHRRAVVQSSPRAAQRAFLLTEFADLLEDAVRADAAQQLPLVSDAAGTPSAPEQLRHGVRLAGSRRGLAPRRDAGSMDVLDPYRRAAEVYEASAEQIREAVERVQRAAEAIARGAIG